ncbi:MFS transporter [Virgibacillus sp. MSJ-26]|uniref:MFS transporter n=1 Tax=Virgibacillus sp. MSJ-26 TaxID=2841522 RepID=UPI001C0FBE7F|nr:MFS transporter [Virgibacillus sp. MSJ-26]
MSKDQSLTPLKMLLFSFHATNTIILSYLPLYLRYKGLNGTEIGWVLAVGPLASIFSQPFWGYLSDKHKTVKLMIQICVVGLLVTSVLFFQMNTLIAILLMGAVFYFFTSPIGALGDSLAQRSAEVKGVPFGSIRTWGSIGFAFSSLIIGAILTRVGIQYMIWPYLLFGLIAFIVTFKVPDVKVDSEPLQFSDIKELLTTKPYFIFLILMLFITVTHRASDSFIGLYIAQLGGTESLVGVGWFVGVMSEAVIFATAGWWFRKYRPLVFVILAGAIYAIRWFLYAAADQSYQVIILQVFHGLSFGIFYTAAFDYVSRIIPRILQSTGHLVFFATFFGVSGIIGSLVGGALIDSYGGSTLYFWLGCSALIGTILLTAYHVLPYGKDERVRQVE